MSTHLFSQSDKGLETPQTVDPSVTPPVKKIQIDDMASLGMPSTSSRSDQGHDTPEIPVKMTPGTASIVTTGHGVTIVTTHSRLQSFATPPPQVAVIFTPNA